MNHTAREFARLRAAIEQRLPETAPFLPGATDHDLERLATATGLVLPADLSALLRTSAGQDDPDHLDGPLNFHHFLTIDEIIDMHRMLTDTVGDMAEPVEQPAYYRWTVWSPSWLPFLAFEGDCYLLDGVDNRGDVIRGICARSPLDMIQDRLSPLVSQNHRSAR